MAVVFVSDIDRAVQFYTETLGLKLQFRAEDKWAEVDAGSGFTLGLHLAGSDSAKPGERGAISVGLNARKPLDQVVATLRSRGVIFRGPIQEDPPVRLAFFNDPDGNDLHLWESKGKS
ncbi:MAG TPA: VOC family protein [Candidatus Deferrimicrobium sp.]|nr:VOC family protein [Candidatus Deferrimicrobium sp.]